MSSSVASQDTLSSEPGEGAEISKLIECDGYELCIRDLTDGRQVYDLTIWDDASKEDVAEAWSLIPDEASKIDGFDYIEGRSGSVYIYEFGGTS